VTATTSQPVSKRVAAAASLGLSVLFVLAYGACNRFTALRHDVGTFAFSWERFIPFVPIMVVPYMSIDLLFVAAPFLCGDRDELRAFGRRVILAIGVSAAFFLLMPLRFSFERPHVDGVLGLVFDNFRKLDLPYNQFPSLHIALRTILADLYARHTRGAKRFAFGAWFSLIGASTLLTWQHHVIDVAGGFALGALCLYAVSDGWWRMPVARMPRIALYYLAGAAACVAAAVWLPSRWAMLLLWPALSLGIVAGAYFGAGPGVFRKRGGRLPPPTWLVLAPVILGQWLSMRHYARRSRPWDRVAPGVWVGRTLSAAEAREAIRQGVTAVLDLTGELPEARPFRGLPHYLNLPVLDLTAPTPGQLREAVNFIEGQVRAGRIVYVHCKAGYSRSAAVAAAYLVHTGRAASADAAVSTLRGSRQGIIIRPEALAAVGAV
jgi:protein-tyrosine phosphatase/membrane-associated phospholipid phosphatase